MKTLDEICTQLANGEFSFSHHAFRRAVERNISDKEIRQAGMSAQLIEAYLYSLWPVSNRATSGINVRL